VTATSSNDLRDLVSPPADGQHPPRPEGLEPRPEPNRTTPASVARAQHAKRMARTQSAATACHRIYGSGSRVYGALS
jgi:hypothetical protein